MKLNKYVNGEFQLNRHTEDFLLEEVERRDDKGV